MSEGGEPKQDSQNQLRLPMSEGGEPKQDIQIQLSQGRALYYLLKVNKHWHDRKG